MSMRLVCPSCGKNLKAPGDLAGKTAICPACHTRIVLPTEPILEVDIDSQEPEQITEVHPSLRATAHMPSSARPTGFYELRRRRRLRRQLAIVICAIGVATLCGGLLIVMARRSAAQSQGERVERSKPTAVSRETVHQEPTDIDSVLACGACGGCLGVAIMVGVGLVILHIILLAWVARDARSRAMDSAFLWMLLVLIVGLFGLLIYLFARPSGILSPCRSCGNKRLQASAKCPHCGNA
jgi:hypothetical protein